MNESEICRSYREAKDKVKQIPIIAQLALVEEREVRRVLEHNGFILPDREASSTKAVPAAAPKAPEVLAEPVEKPKRPRVEWDDNNVALLAEMTHAAVPVNKIAEAFGTSEAAIRFQIKSRRLLEADEPLPVVPHMPNNGFTPCQTTPKPALQKETSHDRLIRWALTRCGDVVAAFEGGEDTKALIKLGELKQLLLNLKLNT